MKYLRLLTLSLLLSASAAHGGEPDPIEAAVGTYLRAFHDKDFATLVSVMDMDQLDEWRSLMLETARIAADKGTMDVLKNIFGTSLSSYQDFSNAASGELYELAIATMFRYTRQEAEFEWEYVGYVSETDDRGYAVARVITSYPGLGAGERVTAVPIRLAGGKPLIGIDEIAMGLAASARMQVDPDLMAEEMRRSYQQLDVEE